MAYVIIGALGLFYARNLVVLLDFGSDLWLRSCRAPWKQNTRFCAFFHYSSVGSRPIQKRRAGSDSTQSSVYFIQAEYQDPTNIDSGDRGGWHCGGGGIYRDIVAGAVELCVTALAS